MSISCCLVQNNIDEHSESFKFQNMQRECSFLFDCLNDAMIRKINSLFRDELSFWSFCKDKIYGDTVYQLIWLKNCIKNWFEHNFTFENHLELEILTRDLNYLFIGVMF